MITISELRKKEVINVRDGKRLGFVCDLDIDLCKGQIRALIVPAPSRWFSVFGKESDYVINWDNIVRIGIDVILVNLDNNCS